jgi:hypothetical protein
MIEDITVRKLSPATQQMCVFYDARCRSKRLFVFVVIIEDLTVRQGKISKKMVCGDHLANREIRHQDNWEMAQARVPARAIGLDSRPANQSD